MNSKKFKRKAINRVSSNLKHDMYKHESEIFIVKLQEQFTFTQKSPQQLADCWEKGLEQWAIYKHNRRELIKKQNNIAVLTVFDDTIKRIDDNARHKHSKDFYFAKNELTNKFSEIVKSNINPEITDKDAVVDDWRKVIMEWIDCKTEGAKKLNDANDIIAFLAYNKAICAVEDKISKKLRSNGVTDEK